MSTRAGIIIKDKYDQIHYYRHSDGYPEGTLPTLNIFLDWVKTGRIRDNVSQAAGWLVIIGALEYKTIDNMVKIGNALVPGNFKVGAYQPIKSVKNFSDLEYIYTIDLQKKEITYKEA